MPPSNADTSLKAHRRGTHRARSPDETLRRLLPTLGRYGITRVANVSGLDRIGLPVVAVCRPNARSSAVFHGKGVDLVSAKVSGIMEAIETWHAENIQQPLLFGSVHDLAGRFALADLDGLARRSAAPLPAHVPLLWIEGRDLMAEASAWLPFETVHADFRVDGPVASGCFAMDTNGLASGNILLEAVSHGLCEVIERDATALWRASPPAARERMRLDLAGVTDPLCTGVLARLAAAGIEVAAWDITTDIGVPAVQCVLKDAAASLGHIGLGAGCHPARDVALLRALTEAAQVRLTYIAGSREDLRPDDYAPATLRSRHDAVTRMLEGPAPSTAFDSGPATAFDDFTAEVAWLLERLRDAGFMQAIAVDLSRADAEVAVVRVVVPGLEGSDHHRESYVPGPRTRRRAGAA